MTELKVIAEKLLFSNDISNNGNDVVLQYFKEL
jgi:hypothetical protein